jgi:hypothetical protein
MRIASRKMVGFARGLGSSGLCAIEKALCRNTLARRPAQPAVQNCVALENGAYSAPRAQNVRAEWCRSELEQRLVHELR